MEQAKAMGLFRLAVTDTLQVFRMYGMATYIPEVASQLERLALELHDRLLNQEDV